MLLIPVGPPQMPRLEIKSSFSDVPGVIQGFLKPGTLLNQLAFETKAGAWNKGRGKNKADV